MASIKDKIKKLLALGGSPNENEARDALLKAKELMAKYKMSEAEFEEKDLKINSVTCNNVKWTTDSGNIWMAALCKTLCDNYCCSAAWSIAQGTRTHVLVITGLGDDVTVCKEICEYAVGFVLGQIKILQRKYSGDSKSIAKSYADGFVLGLEMAFEEQKEQHQEWGLVVSKPQEVQDYERSLGSKNVRTRRTSFDPLAYLKGQNDGKAFNAKKVLAG